MAVAVEKDEERKKKSRTEVADMVGSFRMCRGSNALTEEFDEWQFSTEAQRDIMAPIWRPWCSSISVRNAIPMYTWPN